MSQAMPELRRLAGTRSGLRLKPLTLIVAAVGCAVLGGAAVVAPMTVVGALAVSFLSFVALLTERRKLGMLLWYAVAFSAPFQGVRAAPFLALSDILLVVAVLAVLPDASSEGRSRIAPTPLVWALVLIVAAGLLGTIFAVDPIASLLNIFKLVIAAGASVVGLAIWRPPMRTIRVFAGLWIAGTAANTCIGLFVSKLAVGRVQGLTTQPNHLGLICVLATALGVGLVLSASDRRLRTLTLSGIAVCVIGVAASGSRAALLGEVAAILSIALLARRPRLLVGTAIVAVVFGLAAGVGIIRISDTSALSRLAGGGGSQLSDLERKINLTTTVDRIRAHPVTGEGFESALEPHDIYLQPLLVGGPLALVALVLAAWTILHAGRRGVAAAFLSGSREGLFLAGLTGGYIGYLVSGIFQNIAWDRYLWIYIGLLVLVSATIQAATSTAIAGLDEVQVTPT